jgi:hypothetical protein
MVRQESVMATAVGIDLGTTNSVIAAMEGGTTSGHLQCRGQSDHTVLTLDEIELIVDLLLNDLRARLGERRIGLVVTEPALRFIAEQGFDPSYGARPLRRFIAREVETRVGRALLRGDLPEGGEVFVDLVDGELIVISRSGPPEEREAA